MMQVAGTAQQAIAASNQGKSQQAYYNLLATQSKTQADELAGTADINTGLVSNAAAREDTNLTRTVSTVEGSQRAANASSGVWAGSKTAENIAQDTENKAQLDRAAIRTNANLQSQKITTETKNQQNALRNQAQSYLIAGDNARVSGSINAMNSVLNGATAVAGNWYQWKQLTGSPATTSVSDLYGKV